MTWSITEIKAAEDVAVIASFSVTDGTSTVSSDIHLLPEDAASFASTQNVTEQMVAGWVKAALGDQVAVYEAMVADKTNAVEPEPVPLPWNN